MSDRSVAEVAKELSVSKRQVQRWIEQGRFPGAYKLTPGGLTSPYRVPSEDVRAFREAQRAG